MDRLSFKKINMNLIRELLILDALLVNEDLVDIYINDQNLLKIITLYEFENQCGVPDISIYDEYAPFNNKYYYSQLWNHNGEKEKKNINLYCCTCGECMCWRLSIDIEFTESRVIWKNWNIHTPDQCFKDFPELVFDKKEYKKAIDSLKIVEDLEQSNDVLLKIYPLKHVKVEIKIDGKEFYFLFDEYGSAFFPINKPKIEFKEKFKFDYFNTKIKISIENKKINFGFYKFVKLAKVYTLIHKKYFYLISEKYPEFYNIWLIESSKFHFDELTYKNFIIEIELGSFNKELSIFQEKKVRKMLKEILENSSKFYTHLVGYKYNLYRFEDKDLENKKINLMWENDNKHDSNAVIVLDEYAQKLGYLRKTISPFFTEILKNQFILEGKILKYINQDYIFIEIDL